MWQKNFKLILVLNLISITGFAKPWDQIYEQVKPSVPLLITKSAICSGALVQNNLILTAAHCVSTLRNVWVTWPEKLGQYEPGQVVALDKKKDLAYVRIYPTGKRPLELVGKDVAMKPGEPIATIGHPTSPSFSDKDPGFYNRDETYLLSAGIVSGIAEGDYITDMSVSPGNSGGPALNQDGKIVGVVSRKRIGMGVGAIGYAVKSVEAHKLMEKIPNDPNYEVPFYQASTDFHLDLRFSQYQFFKDLPVDKSTIISLGAVLDIWDRWRIEGEWSTDNRPEVTMYGTGYNFVFDCPNRSTVEITPMVESVKLAWEIAGIGDSRTATAWGFSFFWTGFPIRVRNLNYSIDGKNYSTLSFQLPLM